jgi:hypothetical protein
VFSSAGVRMIEHDVWLCPQFHFASLNPARGSLALFQDVFVVIGTLVSRIPSEV